MHRGAAAPSVSNRHVPPELDDIVLRAVAPNPASRFQSAATLAAELRSMAAILEVRGGAGDEEEQGAARSTSVGRTVVTAVAILVVLGVVFWWFGRT